MISIGEGQIDWQGLPIEAATRQLAKRQMTWLRGMGDAVVMDCLDARLTARVGEAVKRFLDL